MDPARSPVRSGFDRMSRKRPPQVIQVGNHQVPLPEGVSASDWALERVSVQNPRIRSFLAADAFWDVVLPRVAVVTIAREPYHCGGFRLGAQLWRDFSAVFFGGLLGVEEP